MIRFTSRRFIPFVILGGLFRLAILAAVLVVLYRHWGKRASSPSAPEHTTPPETEAEATEAPLAGQEEEAAPASSTEVEPELDTADGEGIEPEEVHAA